MVYGQTSWHHSWHGRIGQMLGGRALDRLRRDQRPRPPWRAAAAPVACPSKMSGTRLRGDLPGTHESGPGGRSSADRAGGRRPNAQAAAASAPHSASFRLQSRTRASGDTPRPGAQALSHPRARLPSARDKVDQWPMRSSDSRISRERNSRISRENNLVRYISPLKGSKFETARKKMMTAVNLSTVTTDTRH